jgi:hypothetical protein
MISCNCIVIKGNIMNKTVYKIGAVAAFAGVLISPVVAGALATDTKGTTINASVASTISMTTSATVNVALTPTSGGVVSSASDTVSVATNSANGYALSLSDGDTNTNLVNGANTIAAHAGTFNTPTALAANTWGYRVVSAGGFTSTAYSAETNAGSSTSTWAGLPSSASPQQLKTTSTTATADTTTVWYGVKANTSIPNGSYSDTVTYTATTNS